MIIGHLITRGFSVEQCKEKIDNYFGARNKMPDVLLGRSPFPPNMERYLREGFWIVPPMKTKENHRVLMFRCDFNNIILTYGYKPHALIIG